MSLSIAGIIPAAAQQACLWGKGVVSVRKDISPDLRYRLIDKFGPLSFCNFECGGPCPISIDQKHVMEIFREIKQDEEIFRAISRHLGLQTDLSDEQKRSVYYEYEKLACGMTLERQGKDFNFKLLSDKGFRIEGVVKQNGEIVVLEKEPAALICPK